MIKFKQGSVENCNGDVKDIIVVAKATNGLKEFLIGGSMIAIGVVYLTYTAFKNGSEAHDLAKFKTLKDLGIIE